MADDQGHVSRAREFVRQVQDEGRLDLIDDFIHPDFTNHTAEGGGPAGRDGVRVVMGALHAAFDDMQTEIVHCFEHDGVVATNKVIHGRHTGDWFGQAPTGSRIRLRVLDFLRFEDGRIIEHWSALRAIETVPE